jgi:hypothetical protein
MTRGSAFTLIRGRGGWGHGVESAVDGSESFGLKSTRVVAILLRPMWWPSEAQTARRNEDDFEAEVTAPPWVRLICFRWNKGIGAGSSGYEWPPFRVPREL